MRDAPSAPGVAMKSASGSRRHRSEDHGQIVPKTFSPVHSAMLELIRLESKGRMDEGDLTEEHEHVASPSNTGYRRLLRQISPREGWKDTVHDTHTSHRE